MAKILKNTTGSDINLITAGVTVPASSTYDIQEAEYLIFATDEVVTELTPHFTSGDLVLNDGVADLTATYAAFFIRYPDTAFNVRFLSEPERSNCFTSKTVQEAIEEARGGATISPTTTTDATPTVAYSLTLDDDKVYEFRTSVTARRTDATDSGCFKQVVCVRREGGGVATIVGSIFQSHAVRTDSGMEICWDVSGNDIQLKVTGVASKTIEWQPEVTFTTVC